MVTKDREFFYGAVKVAGDAHFSIRSLLAKTGKRSTRTPYVYFRKWQKEMGQTGKIRARRIIIDYAIYNSWHELLKILNEVETNFPEDPIGLLKQYSTQVAHFFANNLDLIRIVIRGTPSWASESLRRFPPPIFECWSRLGVIIRNAQEKGLGRHIDPDLLLRMIHGALHQPLYGLTLKGVTREQYLSADIAKAMESLLDGLCSQTLQSASQHDPSRPPPPILS